MKNLIAGLGAATLLAVGVAGAAGSAQAADPYATRSTHVTEGHTTVAGHDVTVSVGAADGATGTVTFTITGWYWVHGSKVHFTKKVTTRKYQPGLALKLSHLHRGHYHIRASFDPSKPGWRPSHTKKYVHVKP